MNNELNTAMNCKINLYLILCIDSDWIVVNRGLYICDECCSIHRSLGRHISQIKSLSADWCPITLNVSTLTSLTIILYNEFCGINC